ncbi:hypothetical protein D3C86_1332660 [compost metagenome]
MALPFQEELFQFELTLTLRAPQGTKLSVAEAIPVVKTISDPYCTDRSKCTYKSGINKIIGSVDKVANHCLNEVSLVCDRPTH